MLYDADIPKEKLLNNSPIVETLIRCRVLFGMFTNIITLPMVGKNFSILYLFQYKLPL